MGERIQISSIPKRKEDESNEAAIAKADEEGIAFSKALNDQLGEIENLLEETKERRGCCGCCR